MDLVAEQEVFRILERATQALERIDERLEGIERALTAAIACGDLRNSKSPLGHLKIRKV